MGNDIKDIESEWDEVIGNRTKQKTGCPYCSGRRKIDSIVWRISAQPE